MAWKVEELTVYQKACEFWEAVTALLDRARFRSDRKLRDQISDAVDSIASNISEGFEQSTDRAFARYLYLAKGSTAEVCTRLRQAHGKRHISDIELARCLAIGDQLARMLAKLIRYLERSDFKDRGRFKQRVDCEAGKEAATPGGTRAPGNDDGRTVRKSKDQGPGELDRETTDPIREGPRDSGTERPDP